MSNAVAGVGTIFERYNGVTWEDIAEVTSIEGPDMDRDYNAAVTAFYGKIDEFAIYNKVLTESEILKLYNSGSGNQYPFE